MEEIPSRRPVMGRERNHTLLPLRTRRLTSTISCWYCDLKISAFNESIFRFGRRHARILRLWFSMGISFSLATLIVVTMILVWEVAGVLHLHNGNKFSNIFGSFLFGFSPSVSGSALSLSDLVYLCFSTLVSVSVHEFGHALSAASEGVQMEYIAIFLAGLFPGALVAFNEEVLQVLPRNSSLRIYSAGIWHNVVCSAACGLALLAIPILLFPFYIHSENPMVLTVSPTSPLFGYLSTGDKIVSLDRFRLHNTQDWVKITSNIHQTTLNSSIHIRKGYCVPKFMIEESNKAPLGDNQPVCPKDLAAFFPLPCSDKQDDQKIGESGYCLAAANILKFNKCGDWVSTPINQSTCLCQKDELCMSPVRPGLTWVEITYSSPYSSECLHLGRKMAPGLDTYYFEEKCRGAFVFIGDLISMAHSIQLTTYQSVWPISFGAYFPHFLEKVLMGTYHVSLTLALLNSLPVYFLDGESILEVSLGYFNLSNSSNGKVLQACLLGGTLFSILVFLKMFILNQSS